MTLFTLNVVFLPSGCNHESSCKYIFLLAAQYILAILPNTIRHDAEYGAQFAETGYAHASSGEVKLGSQTEYLGMFIVLMEENVYCIISEVLYLEYHVR